MMFGALGGVGVGLRAMGAGVFAGCGGGILTPVLWWPLIVPTLIVRFCTIVLFFKGVVLDSF